MLSIVIVNYNSLSLIQDCLDSLRQFHPNLVCEIFIVNNANDSHEADSFKRKNDSVQWLEMGYNAGFARANNLGIEKAVGDTVLLLNPDTVFIEPILQDCVDNLIQDNETVALGVQLLNEDESFQISGSYFMKGGLNHLLPLPYWGNMVKAAAEFLGAKAPHLKGNNPSRDRKEVDWINGAFLMVKRIGIEKAGLLDDDFFMYAEEAEWCARLSSQGKLFIYPSLTLKHIVGGTSEKQQASEYYDLYSTKGLQIMVSIHLRIRKQYGVFYFLFLYLNYLFASLVGLIIASFHSLFAVSFIPLERNIKLFKNVIKLTKLLLTILRNKPHFYKLM